MLVSKKIIIAILGAVMLLGSSAKLALAQEHDHGHAHHGVASDQLSLNDGKKWEGDGNLRQGMSRIRDALNADLNAIHMGKATGKQYQALAKKIDAQIEFMVNNCKLEPKADAMLHLLLADIIAGADAMKQPDIGDARKGAEGVAQALESYGNYFTHPGWNKAQHGH